MEFAENLVRKHGLKSIRLDTYSENPKARILSQGGL